MAAVKLIMELVGEALASQIEVSPERWFQCFMVAGKNKLANFVAHLSVHTEVERILL